MRSIYKKIAIGFIILMFLTPTALRQSHAVLYAFTFESNRSVLRHSFYVVDSDDMYPTIKPRAIVIMRLCEPEEVKEGDLITVDPYPNAIISRKSTRRLLSVLTEQFGDSERWFMTKGDSILCKEELISANQLLGKVIGRIPSIGSILYIKPTTLLLTYIFCWSLALFVIIQLVLRRRRELREKATSSPNTPTTPGAT